LKGQFATNWLYVPHIEIQIKKLLFDKKKTPTRNQTKKLDAAMDISVSLYSERKLIQ